MAAGDITYGTRTALANVSRLHSLADGQAKTFGEVAGAGELGVNIHLVVPINSAATGGTYDLYLVESQDGAEWTDNIDPTVDTGDVLGKISDARFLKSIDTTYDATNRTEAEVHVHVPMMAGAQYIGFVLDNNSGQSIPASGADGDSVTYKLS